MARNDPTAAAGSFADDLATLGRVGADLLAVDWASTPLGPPDSWPRSLTAVVRIMLTSRFAMWMAWGPELTFFCNDAYRRDTLGVKYPWALGRPSHEVWAEIWPEIGPRIGSVMETGDATWDEALQLYLVRSGFEEETYHTFSYSPLTDDAGTIAGMLCVVAEETERVVGERRMRTLRDLRADTGLAEDESAFVAAFERQLDRNRDDLPFTLAYVVEDGVARLAGSSGPEVLGAADAAWPLDPSDSRMLIVDALPPGVPKGARGVAPGQAVVVPLPAAGTGEPAGFLVAGVTPFRPLDEAHLAFFGLVASRLADGIATVRAYRAERSRAEQLAELDRAKTLFFTNVSHELRTPLTLLLGPASDALADAAEPLGPAQRERLEVIGRNASRLLQLVNTLLDFSRLESGRAEPELEPVDLAAETIELASLFRPATDRAGLTLEVDAVPLPAPVRVDREMWSKVVMNLLSNALKFTPSGTISVRVGADGDRARLEVRDTGISIPEAEMPRLFERFHRVASARARTHEGSGIGLALVAELVELLGGTVRASSVFGEGSSFTVELPFAEDGQLSGEAAPARLAEGYVAEALRWLGAEAPEPEPAASAEPQGRTAARTRVLVVDDEADMRAYVARLLGAEHDVITARDGVEALEAIRAQPPDLVLTDVMMPRLDGFGLLAALREDPATARVPVIMLSARAGEDGTVEGIEAGADDYLVKPFSARELLARVRGSLELDRVRRNRDDLRRSEALLEQTQRLAKVASWELDVASGRVIGSEEYAQLMELSPEELGTMQLDPLVQRIVHPEDDALLRDAIAAAIEGAPLDLEFRRLRADGGERLYHAIGRLTRAEDGTARTLYGSIQDITEQRRAERSARAAALEREAATREAAIADELQRSLLPDRSFDLVHLEIAADYRPGVAGTQVGGDWYDVIELSAGRVGLVIGDVMGRGVRAAAVMGQVRTAARAYARLDLAPSRILELLDGVVDDLGEDQIVTCLYAVFDPTDRTLTFACAGHLPPLLLGEDRTPIRLGHKTGPPLGSGMLELEDDCAELEPGALIALYTDGLVERRDEDLDTGIALLAASLAAETADIAELPGRVVDALAGSGQDDDVALLVARLARDTVVCSREWDVAQEPSEVPRIRRAVAEVLAEWEITGRVADDALLVVNELVTNAVVHARAPIELRLRRDPDELVAEVHDGGVVLPVERRPEADDEHGRGLMLTTLLSRSWGTRPLPRGKAVWCTVPLGPDRA